MSKTGIITFHASANCGSMLQAYALQIFLKSLNVTNEIIDFSNAGQRKMYSVFFSPKSIKEFLRLCLNTLFSPVLLRESKDFADFSRKYLELSEQKFYRNEELVEANLDYDCYVAGSDQVWNVKCKDADLAYFLNFVKEPQKKIAYAVSMGGTDINDLTQEKKQLYKTLVEDFSAISVRESNAKEWIEQLASVKVTIQPDPTLLLSKNEWERLASSDSPNSKFIFWYCMNYKDEERKAIQEFAKKKGLDIYIIDAKEWSRRSLYLHGIKLFKQSGPSAFLSLIKNAEYVITSSFHGTVFSSIFEKKFVYLKNKKKISKDTRAQYILEQLGLSDRLIDIHDLSQFNIDNDIDYKSVEDNILKLRHGATEWITKNIVH